MKRKLFPIFTIGILAATLLCGAATGAETAADGAGALGAPKDFTMQEIEELVGQIKAPEQHVIDNELDKLIKTPTLSQYDSVEQFTNMRSAMYGGAESDIVRVELVWYNGHRVYAVQTRKIKTTHTTSMKWQGYSGFATTTDSQDFCYYNTYYIGASDKKIYGRTSYYCSTFSADFEPDTSFTISIDSAKKIALKETGGGTVVSWAKKYDAGEKCNVYSMQIVNGSKKYYLGVGVSDKKIYHKKQLDITPDSDLHTYPSLKPGADELTAKQIMAKAQERMQGSPVFVKCELVWKDGKKLWDVRATGGSGDSKVYCEMLFAPNGKEISYYKHDLLGAKEYKTDPPNFTANYWNNDGIK